ncbi:LysM peptidoglycan-binding domain-containing protein [Arthrobacter sp. LAPM80]|uniref:LysM peptidoglycan-binding domain-containing protein n=1 Tax=Arthrobacter sp. LAPM80 TaxID=3141788 RepID=UPI00398B1311
MTPPRPSSPGSKQANGGRQLAAVATAAIPVVMLSSLALATPAGAAPAAAELMPHGNHGALDAQKVLAAVQARTASNNISAAVVASSVPRAVTAMGAPAVAKAVQTVVKAQPGNVSHTVVAGDTVSGIAAKYGVSTDSVLKRNQLTPTTIIHPGKVLSITESTPAVAPAAATPTASATYTVTAGDTLSGIAAKHKISLATVFSLNGLNGGSTIYPGQKIKVGGQAAAAPASPSTAQAPKPASGGGNYIIRAGDTLSAIASQNGVSLSALVSANGLNVNAPIYPGKTLTIPGVKAAAGSVTPITAGVPELAPDQQVPSTFLHYTYPQAVVNDANKNKALLLGAPAPSRAQMKDIVSRTASQMGIDPALALAFAQQESGFNHQSVSPANAIGTMQVIPDAGDWASGLVGRKLNLLDPQDNVTAGIAIIRALHRGASSEDIAIAGYYQGQYSVSVHGLFPDTEIYVAGIKANRELFR